jgi:hypothetical protein
MSYNNDLPHFYKIFPIEDPALIDIAYLNTATITKIEISNDNTNWSLIYTSERTQPYLVKSQIDDLITSIQMSYLLMRIKIASSTNRR